MPTAQYTALANVTLSTTATSVTFSSISQAYKDLMLVCSPVATSQLSFWVRANSDSTSNYLGINLRTQTPPSFTSQVYTDSGFTTGFSASVPTSTGGFISKLDIMDYSATDKHKTALIRSNGASQAVEMTAQRWASTSAITSLACIVTNSSFAAGTTFALYGVA